MTTLINTAESFGLPSLAGWLKKFYVARLREAKAKETIRQLSRLSTHDLNDIGIARGDIRNIAYGDPTLTRSVLKENPNLRGWV